MIKCQQRAGEVETDVCRRFQTADIIDILSFSTLFGLARAVYDAHKNSGIMIPKLGVFFLSSIFCAFFLILISILMQQLWMHQSVLSSSPEKAPSPSRKHFFLLFLIAYTVSLLTWFPGTTYYDTMLIYFNRMTMMTQFPPIYCLLITLAGDLGRAIHYPRLTMILLSVMQIIAASAMMAQICHWIWKRRLPVWFKIVAFLFCILNPLYSMYAIAIIKDTLSSLSLVVIMTVLYDMAKENGERETENWRILSLCIAFPPAFRSNGFFIILILLSVMFFHFRNSRRKILFLFAELLIIWAAGELLYWRFGVTPFIKEALAIPLQQLFATVAWEGSLTAEQADFINNLFPLQMIREYYNPAIVDPIKWHAEFGGGFLDANLPGFFKIWFEVLQNNFGIYVKAFLLQTLGYWLPANLHTTDIFTTIEGLHTEYLAANRLVVASVWGDGPLQTFLEGYYRSARHFPSEGIWIWLMFFCCFFRELINRDRQSLMIFAPCFLCWASLMISAPVSYGTRYTLCFYYGIPVFVTLAFNPSACLGMDCRPEYCVSENDEHAK